MERQDVIIVKWLKKVSKWNEVSATLRTANNPIRGMSEAKDELLSTGVLNSCCNSERFRLLRGAEKPSRGFCKKDVIASVSEAILLKKTRKRIAFTLAEVLLTLGIIGVVSAMTIPNLISYKNEKTIITKLVKFQSTFNQAILMNKDNVDALTLTKDNLLKYYNAKMVCENVTSPCVTEIYKDINNGYSYAWGINDVWLKDVIYALLMDGTILRYSKTSGNYKCNRVMGSTIALRSVCGEISIDVNGRSMPNTRGKDVFFFFFTPYGLIPFGDKNITVPGYRFYDNCGTIKDGTTCAAYVLKYKSLNYNQFKF